MLPFFRLSAAERRLLLQALFLLGVARVALRLARLRTVRIWVGRLVGARHPSAIHTRQRIIWAVEAASRRLPGATTCLPRAFVAHALLAREGYAARLRIGVALSPEEGFSAHAWVECDGAPVIGGRDLGRYRPLLQFDALELASPSGGRSAS